MRLSNLIFLLLIIPSSAFPQVNKLKKAYAQGYYNPTLPIYRAEFKNFPKDKEYIIHDWLEDNGLQMSDWRLHEKERFGGNTKLMISWVEFMEQDEYNFYQALNKNRASSFLDYLAKPNKSPENERLAIVGLSKVTHTIKDCAGFSQDYPNYSKFFRQRAFALGDVSRNGQGWLDYITYFPETVEVTYAIQGLCESASSLGELISYAKEVEVNHSCFIERGNILAQDKLANKQAISSFYTRYPNNPQRALVLEALFRNLDNLPYIAKIIKANPAIKTDLLPHAYETAKSSLDNMRGL